MISLSTNKYIVHVGHLRGDQTICSALGVMTRVSTTEKATTEFFKLEDVPPPQTNTPPYSLTEKDRLKIWHECPP